MTGQGHVVGDDVVHTQIHHALHDVRPVHGPGVYLFSGLVQGGHHGTADEGKVYAEVIGGGKLIEIAQGHGHHIDGSQFRGDFLDALQSVVFLTGDHAAIPKVIVRDQCRHRFLQPGICGLGLELDIESDIVFHREAQGVRQRGQRLPGVIRTEMAAGVQRLQLRPGLVPGQALDACHTLQIAVVQAVHHPVPA